MDHRVRFARNGDVHIAYQAVGDGPIDLVHTTGIFSNLDVMWEDPRWARYLGRLASFSRLILFDMRGVGLSDRGTEPPVVELQMDDVRAVMDAAGSESAAVFGAARGAAPSLLFAASYPERVRALVLYAPTVRTLQAPDFPWGRTEEGRRAFYERFVTEMGTGQNLDLQGPSGATDERFTQWWARFERLVATPQAFRELGAILAQIDVRSVLPHIQAPALVLHRTGDRINNVGLGSFAAEQIPGARFVELAGDDHLPFLGDQDAILDEIQEFLTGARPAPDTDRVLATVLFTDIVGSTEMAARLADRAWSELWRATICWSERSSSGSVAVRSTPRGTASSPPSTARPEPSAAPRPSPRVFGRSASRFAPGCTRASARAWGTGSPGSQCISPPGSTRWPGLAKCSPRAPSGTWWPGPGSGSRIVARTSYVGSPTPGVSTPSAGWVEARSLGRPCSEPEPPVSDWGHLPWVTGAMLRASAIVNAPRRFRIQARDSRYRSAS
jgi:pimeloyl-ACP methyl ester carboxylesterase